MAQNDTQAPSGADGPNEDASFDPRRKTGAMGAIRGAVKAEQGEAGFFTRRRPLWVYALWAVGIYAAFEIYKALVG